MTAVPQNYAPEPGIGRCGDSFQKTIVVTGEIAGRNGFGKNRKHTIARVAVRPKGKWWSRQSSAEASFRAGIVARLASVKNDLHARRRLINWPELQAIEYVIAIAELNLERVDAIYHYWNGFGEHPETGEKLPADPNAPSPLGPIARPSEWPLTASDAIYEYMGECTGKDAQWVDDRELSGSEVRHIRNYFCPGNETRAQRKRDRNQILGLLLNAARAVRCAQYGIWRVSLYREATQDWYAKYGGLPGIASPTEPGIVPTPGVGFGNGFQYEPVEPIDPGSGQAEPWHADPDTVEPIDPGSGQAEPWSTGPQAPFPPPTIPADWPVPDVDELPGGQDGPGSSSDPLGGASPEEPEGGLGEGAGATEPKERSLVRPLLALGGLAVGLHFLLKGTR